MKRFLISLEDTQYEQIRLMAYKDHKSLSQVIRDLLTESLAKPEKEEREK